MSVASFIAAQRTDHGVPHAHCCRWLEVSESWFYKWHDREPTARQVRRAELDAAVKAAFADSGGTPGHLRVAAGVRGPGRRRLAGVGQHGGRFDVPPGAPGSVPETSAARPDPPPTGRPNRSRTW